MNWQEFFINNQESLVLGTFWFFIFACFHSICAQPAFKNMLAKYFSQSFVDYYWRIIYVFISLKLYFGIATAYIGGGGVIFEIEPSYLKYLQILSTFGKYLFIFVLVELDFLYYFGLKQASKGVLVATKIITPEQWPIDKQLKTSFLYKIVRHPLYFALMLWLLPSINSYSGLFMYALLALYLAIGLPIEEKKLVKEFGKSYQDYQKITPAFIPLTKLAWWRARISG